MAFETMFIIPLTICFWRFVYNTLDVEDKVGAELETNPIILVMRDISG